MNTGTHIRVGSRDSRLAVIQSMTVVDFIRAHHPELDVELVTMKTTGDKILDRTLDKVGGKGLFVKELDAALRDGRADLTVHSLKDMPMEVADDLPLIGFSVREDPRDVLVLPQGVAELKPGLVIGSSSLRRVLQLKKLFPENEVQPVRGNLQTRLRKLDEGQFGALVLAAAGMKRLGLEERISRYFTTEEIIPAAGQGIIGIQGKVGLSYEYLDGYLDADAAAAAICERAFVGELDGGCTSPVCAHAEIRGEKIFLRALYYEEETGACRIGTLEGEVDEAERLGRQLAVQLRGK